MSKHLHTLLHMIPALLLALFAFTTIPGISTGGAAEPGDAAPKIKVLILSGLNNHNWRTTTPKLKSILEATGRFTVEVTEKPYEMTAESLEPFDVILSDWNTFGHKNDEKLWTDDARSAYADFVRRGGGHVTIHAGGCSFGDWDEYLEFALVTWKGGQTSHGAHHEFEVRIDDSEHPITKGVEPFKIFDELWNRIGMPEGVKVLASGFSSKESRGTGNWEPVAIIRNFGEGRCFALTLGHDAGKMEHPGFITLLTRGTEWAATGDVTPEK